MPDTKRTIKPVGLPPGALFYTGPERDVQVDIDWMVYDIESYEQGLGIESYPEAKDSGGVRWLNVYGVHDTDLVGRIGDQLGIHPLLLEDIVNVKHRPKLEEVDGRLHVSCKMLRRHEKTGKVQAEQVSLVIGDGFVVSFQEVPGDVFEPVRERIRAGKGRIRSLSADYLGYALLDTIVDHYIIVLEGVSDDIDRLERQALSNPKADFPKKVLRLRREISKIRKAVGPLRVALDDVDKEGTTFFDKTTLLYLGDTRGHLDQAADMVESYRDALGSAMDSYLSIQGAKTNDVMKVLTLMATIFLPITFVAGVYGMNFAWMPELQQTWGYPAALATMATITAGMLLFFRRKNWI